MDLGNWEIGPVDVIVSLETASIIKLVIGVAVAWALILAITAAAKA